MKLNKILKNTILVLIACLALTACATKKTTTSLGGQIQGDVYTGNRFNRILSWWSAW